MKIRISKGFARKSFSEIFDYLIPDREKILREINDPARKERTEKSFAEQRVKIILQWMT